MVTVLIGGGWTSSAAPAVYEPFLAATAASVPAIGCLVLDEGGGEEYYTRFAATLTSVGPCAPAPILLPLGSTFDSSRLDGFDGLLVCGGHTPSYATALGPAADAVRRWLAAGRPYVGFSAGAAVAATNAVVGGYRLAGRVVCPPDAGEDLEYVSVVDGIGLVPFAVDVHAAQWGTLGRLCAAVATGLVPCGLAIDEDTAVVVTDTAISVVGDGAVHVVTAAAAQQVKVHSVTAGGTVSFDDDDDDDDDDDG